MIALEQHPRRGSRVGRLLALSAAALLVAPASQAGAASVTVTPPGAAPGAKVTVAGEGFVAGARGTLRLDRTALGRARGARAGTVSATVRIPRSARRGAHRLVLRVGRRSVAVPFRVVRATPSVVSSLTVAQGGQRVGLATVSGERVELRGAGFRARSVVRASLGDSLRRAVRADRRGSFRLSFAAPARLAGRRRIVLSSAGVRLSIPFRVTVSGPAGAPGGAGTAAACLNSSAVAPRALGAATSTASSVKVSLPHRLDFGRSHAGVADGAGVGTGFTRVAAVPGRSGHVPANLTVDGGAGVLAQRTTAGTTSGESHWADNALGVGVDAPSNLSFVQATLLGPCATGAGEEAGLFFGEDQRNQVRVAAVSTPAGTKIQLVMEEKGRVTARQESAALDLRSSRVTLALRADPSNRSVAATYRLDGGAARAVSTVTAPGGFFSFDAAGGDNTVGTSTYTGLYATHRGASRPTTFRWDDFSVEDVSPPAAVDTTVRFARSSFPLKRPTSIVEGPDGRLYVSEMGGRIHILTLDVNKRVVDDTVSSALGSRLLLGITLDPASTPGNVVIWASHSSPGAEMGVANSGTVSRLSGTNLSTKADVITGLPRAYADHAPNSLHFGPDGKLYVAIGSNTAGGGTIADLKFGTIEEQPLSAAIVVADVKNPAFRGSCARPDGNLYGPPPCDVTPHATGLRNPYDFVFHPNGQMYSAVNGLGADGAFPVRPAPPCFGTASPEKWDEGGQFPGEQPDLLLRVERDKYYGHPNPSRGECVFRDGRYQDVDPLPNYVPPMHELGLHTSSNGTIAYRSNAFGGALKGDLLIVNFSVPDNLIRVKLSADGRSVVSTSPLAADFDGPLALAEGADGTLYVGEFYTDQVSVLRPGG
jgi:glucose/arabinose dehydrogenase